MRAMELATITGVANINIPYISQSKQLKKYNVNITKEMSFTFFVFKDLIICGNINDVPTTAAL